jgi:hypothetical protein
MIHNISYNELLVAVNFNLRLQAIKSGLHYIQIKQICENFKSWLLNGGFNQIPFTILGGETHPTRHNINTHTGVGVEVKGKVTLSLCLTN